MPISLAEPPLPGTGYRTLLTPGASIYRIGPTQSNVSIELFMADVQAAYIFAQAVRRRRNEILGSPALPFSSVRLLVRLPVESLSVFVGVGGRSTDTTALVSTTIFPYPSPSSTSLLNQATTQLDSPTLPAASTLLAVTNLQHGSQSSLLPMQTSAPSHLPAEPVTITFADVIPIAPLADSGPQGIIRSTSPPTAITKSLSQVTTDIILQEVVTISLSASGSDSNVNSRPTSVSVFSPTPILNDTGSISYSTDAGRPVGKAVGNAFSFQPTTGTSSSTTATTLPLYSQHDPPSGLNPVAVVGCVLAGILSLTVVSFCITWALRSRRRLKGGKTAIL